MKKLLIILGSIFGGLVALIISVVAIISIIGWLNAPPESAIDEYKDKAQQADWMELVDQNVNLNTVLFVNGEVDEISDNNTAVVTDNQGIYYINISTDKSKAKVSEGDSIKVYGKYLGNDDVTGFPKIESQWIE